MDIIVEFAEDDVDTACFAETVSAHDDDATFVFDWWLALFFVVAGFFVVFEDSVLLFAEGECGDPVVDFFDSVGVGD